MADIKGFGLIMYDNRNSDFCRIESDYMKPTNPNFTVNNESFYLEDGILGLAIINNCKYLFFLNMEQIISIVVSIHCIVRDALKYLSL